MNEKDRKIIRFVKDSIISVPHIKNPMDFGAISTANDDYYTVKKLAFNILEYHLLADDKFLEDWQKEMYEN